MTMQRREFLLVGALSAAALASCSRSVGGLAAPASRPLDTTVEGGGLQELRGTGSRATAGVPTTVAGTFAPFATGLLRSAAPTGNAVLSPYSVLNALGMTQLGAAGGTEQKLAHLLGGNGSAVAARLTVVDDALARAVRRANEASESTGSGRKGATVLDVANSLFAQRGMGATEPYLDALTEAYGAALRACDFTGDPEGSRVLINQWVAQRTAGFIPQLLPAKSITPTTRLVLTNALHLRAPWAQQFEKQPTATPFTTEQGNTVSVPMMFVKTQVRYASGTGWSSISLSYAGNGLAMTVILPDPGKLNSLWSRFDAGLLGSAQSGTNRSVEVRLPAFAINTPVELLPALDRMGSGKIFDHTDLSGLAGKPGDLVVTSVIHQAKIAVDENGTEAAAATAVVGSAGAAPGGPEMTRFTADRAFLFCVHDTTTFTPLFLGRVSDPTA